MGGRGRDAAHLARARAKRAPFTDPRDGRLFRQIRFAFILSKGAPLSTTVPDREAPLAVPHYGASLIRRAQFDLHQWQNRKLGACMRSPQWATCSGVKRTDWKGTWTIK